MENHGISGKKLFFTVDSPGPDLREPRGAGPQAPHQQSAPNQTLHIIFNVDHRMLLH